VTFTISPGPTHAVLEQAFARLVDSRFIDALWARRVDAWTDDASVQAQIGHRLGWLDCLSFVAPQLPRLRACAESVRSSGVTDIVLLGMGGSSLAPEVLRSVYGVAAGFPRFHVLDSVDPDAVRAAMSKAESSLFILASKSGSTIEPNVMAAEAEHRLRAAGIADPWSRFIAITDEGTALHARATNAGFRETFVNPGDIGGRYSALSLFGLVPAALMGIDLDALVASGRAMAASCRDADPRRNPGAALGAMMAAGARTGRDKLMIVFPPELGQLGLWVEQLVAESTGKQGKGIVPVCSVAPNEPLGPDRLRVHVGSERGSDPGSERGSDPLMKLPPDMVISSTGLGGEFFRWEFATAIAGFLLGINPFDEPNVQQAKDATRALLDVYTAQQRLPIPEPDAAIEGVRVTMSPAARQATEDPVALLRLIRPGDYFALLAFVPPCHAAFAGALEALRHDVAVKTGNAATIGYGPRYLHSTGQLHKGGPNNGVFLIITAEPSSDLPIPGESYSFGVLERAQALGDFESLIRAGRRALYLHLPVRDPELLQRACTALMK
jgi:glucose-6-phosphate isomerase